jgi:hypothetical protein
VLHGVFFFTVLYHLAWALLSAHFNRNFRILKWRYCTISWAIFCGDIPLHRPAK